MEAHSEVITQPRFISCVALTDGHRPHFPQCTLYNDVFNKYLFVYHGDVFLLKGILAKALKVSDISHDACVTNEMLCVL